MRFLALCAPAAALVALAACGQHYDSAAMGVAGPADPSVTVFRSDRRHSWTSFRLGGGLNVVVVNPNVPREFAWSFAAGKRGISSSPVVYGDTVLVDSNDHHLYALNAATGALRWQYHGESELMSQPVYANGIVIVGTGTGDCSAYFPPYYVVMDYSVNRIDALKASNGTYVWGTGIAGTGMPTPAIVGGDVIHADGSGAILAVDEKTGAYRWHVLTPSMFSMTAVVNGGDGRLYAPANFPNAVYAFSARGGAVLWRRKFSPVLGGMSDGPMASTKSALVGDYLQPLRPGPEGWVVQYQSYAREHVYALDKSTGKVLWDTTLANVKGVAQPQNEAAIPLIYRKRLYVGSAVAPVVTALDPTTGRVLWQLKTMGPVYGGLVARDDIVYFGDLGGYLWAIDARNGRVVGRKREDIHFRVGSPIILNDSLIDGSREGAVIAVPLRWIRDARD